MRSLTSSFPGAVIPKLVSLPNIHEDIFTEQNCFQFCPLAEKEERKADVFVQGFLSLLIGKVQ